MKKLLTLSLLCTGLLTQAQTPSEAKQETAAQEKNICKKLNTTCYSLFQLLQFICCVNKANNLPRYYETFKSDLSDEDLRFIKISALLKELAL